MIFKLENYFLRHLKASESSINNSQFLKINYKVTLVKSFIKLICSSNKNILNFGKFEIKSFVIITKEEIEI